MTKTRKTALALSAATAAYCVAALLAPGLPPVPDSLTVYDRNGVRVGEVPYEGKIRHVPMPAGGWPDFARKTAAALEDRRRGWHFGVDFLAAASAARGNLSGERARGASTLEMQLLRNRLWPEGARGWGRKIAETLLAPAVRLRLGETGVTDAWLDSVPFGNMAYGLEAAALTYFGKPASALTPAETVALACVPNNPSAFDPLRRPAAWRARYERALSAMENAGAITADERAGMLAEKLDFRAGRDAASLPYLRDAVRAAGLSGAVTAAADLGLSEKISKLALESVSRLAWRDVTDAAVLVADRKTMEVRALVGGVSYETKAGQVSSVFSPRQSGSALKPFTYLLAFRDLGMTPESPVLDAPAEFASDKGGYAPKNYSNSYEGTVAAGRALAESMNVPAVRLAQAVGVDKLLAFLRSAGLATLDRSAEDYGLSLTLGSGDVRLWDLVQSYSVFARDGEWCPLRLALSADGRVPGTISGSASEIPGPTEKSPLSLPACRRLADAKHVKMVADSLSDRYLKIGGFPLGGTLDFPDRRVAVKTGTSRNFVDNWAVGWTDNYIVGVWAGNKDGTPMKGVSGATGAGDLFAAVVRLLEPERPAGKNASAAALPPSPGNFFEISSPLPGSEYAAAPGASAERSKIGLRISTDVAHASVRWTVDGREVPDALWPLAPGAHVARAELLDAAEKTLSGAESRFSVTAE